MRILHKTIDLVASLTFVAIMLMVLFQIVMRFVFRIGVPWIEEASRLVYVYLAFLGAAISLREKQLIVIDTIPNILPPPLRKGLAAASELFCFAVLVLLLRGAIKMAGITWGSTLATIDFVSNGWIYVAGAISFGYMILVKIVAFLSGVRAMAGRKGDRA